MILTIVLFILCIIFVFYLPGRALLRISKCTLGDDFVITTACSLSIGVCVFLLVTYLFAWVDMSIIGIILMLLLSTRETVIFLRNRVKIYNKNIFSFEMLTIFIGSFLMAYLMWWSGMRINNELVFYSINATDAMYHLSLIGNLMHHFPPTHAGLDGVSFRGYHFFYDFLLANFSTYFGFNTLDLYFRLFPFFIAFFYGISGFALARFLHISSLSSKIFMFLLYFANGFDLFLTEYFHMNYSTGVIQSIPHILDPNVLFSVAVLFTIYIFIFQKNTIFQIILAGILLGVLPNIKVYTAILAFSAFLAVSVVAFLREKKKTYIIIFLLASLIGSIVYLPINYGVGKLIFAPLLLYRHFMESAVIFSSYQWILKYQVYEQHNNYARIIILYIISLGLFFIPNIGLRIVSFFYFPKLLRKNFYTLPRIFWLTIIGIAFFIPSFFIQDSAVFVIIQFLWLGYIFLLLPTSFVFGKILVNKHGLIVLSFFGLLILLTIPNIALSIKTFTQNPTYISQDIVLMTNYIQQKIPQRERIFLLNREKRHSESRFIDAYDVPLISALSNHAVYYEPEVLEFNAARRIVDSRRDIIDMAQQITYTCDDNIATNKKMVAIMKNTNNQYVLTFKNSSCFDALRSFIKVYAKGDLALYKIL